MGRRNDTGTPSPGQPGRLATLSRKGRGGLGSCLCRKDTVPPHPAVPWAPPASPAVGRGVLDCCLRRNDTPGPARREVGQLLDGQGEAGCYIPLS